MKKKTGSTRTATLRLRVTPEEQRAWAAAAASVDRSLSSWIRYAANALASMEKR
jgi:uncharacterized protein (DUF1778 family)